MVFGNWNSFSITSFPFSAEYPPPVSATSWSAQTYIKNAELHGGYTIRLLRDRMSESEIKAFDTQSGMKIK